MGLKVIDDEEAEVVELEEKEDDKVKKITDQANETKPKIKKGKCT